jgi:hypothetical protein
VLFPVCATADLIPELETLEDAEFVCGTHLQFSGSNRATISEKSCSSYLEVARLLGANRLYFVFRVAILAATADIFIALFMGPGASFLTLVLSEIS